MNVEDYGVPAYDELVIVANKAEVNAPKIKKFLDALQQGVSYLRAHPQQTWQRFAKAHPELNTELNQQAWLQSVPLFATDPAALDKPRYDAYEQFLYNNKLVKKSNTFSKLCDRTALSNHKTDGSISVSHSAKR